MAHISAKAARGTKALFEMIRKSYESANKRVTTGELNRFVEHIGYDKELKIYYIAQHGIRPPTFSIFTDKGTKMHFSLQRFVVNKLRKEFGFYGTPIVLKPKRR